MSATNHIQADVAQTLLYERLKSDDDDKLVSSYDRLLGVEKPVVGAVSAAVSRTEVSFDELESAPGVRSSSSSSLSLSSSANMENGQRHQTTMRGENGEPCCPCFGCPCSCHLSYDDVCSSEADRPIDAHVVYLFDYCLFNVPQNHTKFDVLLDYLHEERLYERSYVVSLSSEQQRVGAEINLTRDPHQSDQLRYKPSVIESLEDTRNDVRKRMRGIVVQNSTYNWFAIRAALNYPSIIIYVRLLCSRNDINADHVIVVDPANPQFVSSTGSYGYKIARIIAHTRSKFFGVQHFDFSALLEANNLRALQRLSRAKAGSSTTDAHRQRRRSSFVRESTLEEGNKGA